ncbi:uncharacterized protein LOC118240038 [Cricetulus griseus]|uniref:uncharacterized protein LOC118240038 n=1 Tax=Cricetulus griseus TaxID=10029 RepID=UPI0015C3D1CF|nr:uncharacterized protein LOC118240038 [Cricetulus griseus]
MSRLLLSSPRSPCGTLGRVLWAAAATLRSRSPGTATPGSHEGTSRHTRRHAPGARASANPARTRGQTGSHMTTPSSGHPVLAPPDPGPLSVTPIASPRSSRPRAASAFRHRHSRGLGGFPWRGWRGRSAGGRRARRRHRATWVPSGSVPLTRACQSAAPSAEVFHVDRSLGSHKMGPGSGRRRLHGRRHFVRRGGARLCVMVEASDPPLGNPRR